jgi:hypothetical protein
VHVENQIQDGVAQLCRKNCSTGLSGEALCELWTQHELEASACFDQIIAPDVLEIIVRLQGKWRRP